jgi:hypothetical protein
MVYHFLECRVSEIVCHVELDGWGRVAQSCRASGFGCGTHAERRDSFVISDDCAVVWGDVLKPLPLWPLDPISPDNELGRVVVELMATERDARATYTLKLWDVDWRTISLGNISFPELKVEPDP